jgi:hypothetical protein
LVRQALDEKNITSARHVAARLVVGAVPDTASAALTSIDILPERGIFLASSMYMSARIECSGCCAGSHG